MAQKHKNIYSPLLINSYKTKVHTKYYYRWRNKIGYHIKNVWYIVCLKRQEKRINDNNILIIWEEYEEMEGTCVNNKTILVFVRNVFSWFSPHLFIADIIKFLFWFSCNCTLISS